MNREIAIETACRKAVNKQTMHIILIDASTPDYDLRYNHYIFTKIRQEYSRLMEAA